MLSDKELVTGILTNDKEFIHFFLFTKCAPIVGYIVKNVFHHKAEKDELINELYLYLQEDNWKKLQEFQYRSKLVSWLSVVSTRFFLKKREELIEKEADSALYTKEEKACNEPAQTIRRIDAETLLNLLSNERYKMVLQKLIMEDKEPQQLADEMGITVDNLYNIKRRALQQLMHIIRKESGYGR